MLMPRLRMPLWAAAAVPVAAYALRSLLRGSLRPDMPGDAVVLGALAFALALAALYRAPSSQSPDDDLSEDVQGHDPDEGHGR